LGAGLGSADQVASTHVQAVIYGSLGVGSGSTAAGSSALSPPLASGFGVGQRCLPATARVVVNSIGAMTAPSDCASWWHGRRWAGGVYWMPCAVWLMRGSSTGVGTLVGLVTRAFSDHDPLLLAIYPPPSLGWLSMAMLARSACCWPDLSIPVGANSLAGFSQCFA
jgi:hypothetical protein